jgi:hypothetical protein
MTEILLLLDNDVEPEVRTRCSISATESCASDWPGYRQPEQSVEQAGAARSPLSR